MALLLAAGPLAAVSAPAGADTAPRDPADPRTPVTMTADALPTVQIDGVGLQQLILGNTVYVVGKFSTARPAGAAPGTQTVRRNNILAYDLRTGVLKTGFRAQLNARAFALAAPRTGKVLYVGGDFTKVNNRPARHIVALDPRTGKRIKSFKVSADAGVRTIITRGRKVWFGGNFSRVNGKPRTRLAAVRTTDGRLLAWAPRANRRVNALVLSPDGKKVVVGGAFTKLNRSSKPGYGLGAVTSGTGKLLKMPTNRVIRNAGRQSAINALVSDGTNLYGSGYVYGKGGNLEGAFATRWSDLRLAWIEDCHGDTFGVYPSRHVVYVVGHPHRCRNISTWVGSIPRVHQGALAFSKAATQTIGREPSSTYFNFEGKPAPSLLHWFPRFNSGTTTGLRQGPWAVTGNGLYLAVAGEFTQVNALQQQGLVRFAVSSIAENKQGPRNYGDLFAPTVEAGSAAGEVLVTWPANWDRDNRELTYTVLRDGSPVHSMTAESSFWDLPTLSFLDTGVSPGEHRYRVRVTDAFENSVISDFPGATITVP